jgi:hypothetical protein
MSECLVDFNVAVHVLSYQPAVGMEPGLAKCRDRVTQDPVTLQQLQVKP